MKQAYYFPHDSNARNDVKLLRLRRSLGIEGYGLYFCLIEILREQTNYRLPLSAVPDISFDMHISDEKVLTVIKSFGLFEINENDEFFSPRLIRSMDALEAKRQRYIEAGRKGGKATPKHRLSNAQASEKSKVKKSKEDNNIHTPGKPGIDTFFIDLFNSTKGNGTPTRYKLTDKVKKQLHARIKEGYTSEDFRKAILNCKNDQYHIETGLKHLTPEFITRADKLERHLNNETIKPKFHPGLPHGL